MSSKPKARTYIVLQYASGPRPRARICGRYKVGARNAKEAEQLVRNEMGKHIAVKAYCQVTSPDQLITHGFVIKKMLNLGGMYKCLKRLHVYN